VIVLKNFTATKPFGAAKTRNPMIKRSMNSENEMKWRRTDKSAPEN
jgi:hypothetical protein